MALFEAYSDNGKIQISSEAFNYFMDFKSEDTLNYDVATGWIPEAGDPPFVAPTYSVPVLVGSDLNPTIGYMNDAEVRLAWSPRSTGITINNFYTFSNTSPVVDYYVFKKYSQYTPTSNMGMQLFSQSGTLLFDAAQGKPLRVINVIDMNTVSSGYFQYYDLPAGANVAFFTTGITCRQIAPFGSANTLYNAPHNGLVYGVQKTANGGMAIAESAYSIYTQGDQTSGKVFVLDVTGY